MDNSTNILSAKRVVVKVGSALLVDEEDGKLYKSWLEKFAQDISRMKERGQEIIIVSSGAIALGKRYMAMQKMQLRLDEKQAAAAIGMIRLAHAYQEALEKHNLTVAQILLTLSDSESRRRYINAKNTLNSLLRLGAVPLINENDTVATDEIRFGDNDRLAARVSAMVSADILVLLSNVSGLFSEDPRINPNAKKIELVKGHISEKIEAMAGKTPSREGSGGMVTKLQAARISMSAGTKMVISNGNQMNPLKKLEKPDVGTWFTPSQNPKRARKNWIAGALKPMGTIKLDEGAERALRLGKSLLPAGVLSIDGNFQKGDAVVIVSMNGRELARGLIAYSSSDAQLIKGHKTYQIEALLGYRGRDELIHRDDMVLMDSKE